MLTPFCTPLRSSYRHPATSLQPTPPVDQPAGLLSPASLAAAPVIRGILLRPRNPTGSVRVRRPKNEALSFLGPKADSPDLKALDARSCRSC